MSEKISLDSSDVRYILLLNTATTGRRKFSVNIRYGVYGEY